MVSHTRTGKSAWQGLEIISRGANRLCARDPHDPSHCLKFELPAAERTHAGARQRIRRWLARRLPYFGENHTELRAYRKLHARLGNALGGRVAACHGLIPTASGAALQCDCVQLTDGKPARSLYSHLFEGTDHEAVVLCAAIDRMEAWLVRNHIPLFDLNAGNFVVTNHSGEVELVCVDAKSVISGKEILPFSRWSRTLMHRKLQRRAQRLRERVMATLADGPTLAGRAPPH